MHDVEAVADAATGAVVASAGKPQSADVGPDGHTAEKCCLNCGTALIGEHCHACGQRAHVHRSLHAFGHDLLHGVFHFEGKIWRTVPMLAWRPGELTRRYIAGERARFVSPLAMFLFSVFLMFALFGAASGGINPTYNGKSDLQSGLSESVGEAEASLAILEGERRAAQAAGQPTAAIDARLKNAREELNLLRSMRDKGIVAGGAERMSEDVPTTSGWFQEVYSKAYRKAKQNPELLIYKLQNSAYKYSWALIPISAPFVWLLFAWKRQYKLYDHAVFVTYSIVFMSLLTVVLELMLTVNAPKQLFATTLFLVPPIHMYVHLKQAYRLRWWSAAVRLPLLITAAIISLCIFAFSLVGLGVL